jgi:LacI family transcriptional regulator
MKQLVEHLYKLGHRRIAMIAGRPHVATTFERVNAYKQTLLSHGLPVDEALIHDGSEDAKSFDRLLALRRPPTAILAGNNRSMMRLMQYLHTAGLHVPRDIAVVGFDDFEWADFFHPRLTVISQPIEAIAKRAIALLAACIETPDAKRQTLHIKPKLVVRESCGSETFVGS